jgi:hypothetical protein
VKVSPSAGAASTATVSDGTWTQCGPSPVDGVPWSPWRLAIEEALRRRASLRAELRNLRQIWLAPDRHERGERPERKSKDARLTPRASKGLVRCPPACRESWGLIRRRSAPPSRACT